MSENTMYSVITKIIEYSIVSARMGDLYTSSGFKTRGQINVLLVSSFGSGKSVLFRTIEDAKLGIRCTDYTMPGIIGTIKANGRVVKGFVIHARGSTLLIDEFQKFGKKEKDALLSLMEDHFYRRPLGYNVDPPVEESDEFYTLRAKENYYEVYSKLSFIIGSMYFRRKTLDDYALLSRCFPVVLTMTENDAFDLYLGKTRFKLSDKLEKKREIVAHRDIFVSDEIQKLMAELYKESMKGFTLESGFIARGLWDLTRISAVESALKGYGEVVEEEVYNAIKFAPIQILGYGRGQLTVKQMDVYSVICSNTEGINPSRIIEETGLPEATVMQTLKELVNMNLVEVVRVGKNTMYYPKALGIPEEVGE
jgi:DNA-binding transcriptional ArsR family regulator